MPEALEGRVIVSAGGSGGHVFPAQSFAEALEKASPGLRVHFVTGEKYTTGRDLFERWPAGQVSRVKSAAFRGAASVFSPGFYSSLLSGYAEARRIVARVSPRLVVGFGGHHTVPIALAARRARVPVILHEQNASPGLANRLLSVFAERVGCAFEPAGKGAKYFRAGMPLRPALVRMDRAEALRGWGLDPDKKTLLVAGGSQGARAVNDRVLQFVAQFGEEAGAIWQIVHLTGGADYDRAAAVYRGSRIGSKCMDFCEDMSRAYSAADVALCRAGAVTLHELAFFEKCAILVPYPAANGHQLQNARVLERSGAAFVAEQKDLDARGIRKLLGDIEKDPDLAPRMARSCGAALRAGSDALVEESLRVMAKSNRTGGT